MLRAEARNVAAARSFLEAAAAAAHGLAEIEDVMVYAPVPLDVARDALVNQRVIRRRVLAHQVHRVPVFLAGFGIEVEPREIAQLRRKLLVLSFAPGRPRLQAMLRAWLPQLDALHAARGDAATRVLRWAIDVDPLTI